MLRYAIALSIAIAVALPHQNTLTERLDIATFGLVDGGTVSEIRSQLRTSIATAASALAKGHRVVRRG